MAFSTVTGSNGVTSLVGTTGIDTASIVTLDSNVFIGGNTGDDTITTVLGTGGNNLADYNVRMGGGDDTFTLGNTLLNSTISLDGETIANDGDDNFTSGANLIINSDILGRGGNDVLGGLTAATALRLSGSEVNGNTGDDTITVGESSSSFIYGGQNTDDIAVVGASSALLVNGNKGSDTILVTAVTFDSGSVYGGNGNDTITMLSTTDGVLVSGDKGIDSIITAAGDDTVNGGDDVDTIVTAAGVDTINGGAGNDSINAGTGADVVDVTDGNDTIAIAGGDSVLTGATTSTGFDTITGFAANTAAAGATLTGDAFDVTAAQVTAIASGTAGAADSGLKALGNVASSATSLGGDLAAATTAAASQLIQNGAATVTITGSVAWAGNYVLIDDGAAAANAAWNVGDAVIQTNTLVGIGASTFL